MMKKNIFSTATREYFKQAQAAGLPLWERIHGYIYGKWCYQYIGIIGDKKAWWRPLWIPLILCINWLTPFKPSAKNPIGDPQQSKPTWADTYHGKVMPVEESAKLIKLETPVNTTISEQVLPFTRAREIVLNHPKKIVLIDCPCRAGMENPCTPTEVCLLIGDPFATFMLDQHPDKTREITADEAIRILKQENARGHVSHAFFKDIALGRFYALCNCCSCCCGAMKAHAGGVPMLCSSGYLAEVNPARCVRCGRCLKKCQFNAIELGSKSISILYDACMGCGVCLEACHKNALKLILAPEKGTPLLVDALSNSRTS